MGNNYTQITWPEVRKGDVLLHENGDRLTVESAAYVSLIDGTSLVTVASRAFRTEELERLGFSPYRRTPELPTVPGAYADKDGDFWLLDRDGNWYDWSSLSKPNRDCGIPDLFAPFTRLVPIPTREQVHATVYNALRGSGVEGLYPLRTINAVMALLAGKEADSE